MKLSARNQLKGTVKKINEGAVNVEVMIEVAPGVEIASIITKTSAESLGLREGNEVFAIVKASNVIVGAE